MSLSLCFGRRLGEEIVDAGLRGDGGGGRWIVAGDHHRADAHPAQLGEALPDAALDDILEVNHAEQLAILGHGQRRAADFAIASAIALISRTISALTPGCSARTAPDAATLGAGVWR